MHTLPTERSWPIDSKSSDLTALPTSQQCNRVSLVFDVCGMSRHTHARPCNICGDKSKLKLMPVRLPTSRPSIISVDS